MKPIVNTFYIIEGHIFHSTIDDGIDHSKLWQIIVSEVFQKLDPLNKRELSNAPYGVDRGRVVKKNKGYILYGTKGCREYLDRLKKLFMLEDVKDLEVDFESDPHYKIQQSDKKVFDDIYPLIKDKVKLQDTHIAKAKKNSKLYKKVLAKIKKMDY